MHLGRSSFFLNDFCFFLFFFSFFFFFFSSIWWFYYCIILKDLSPLDFSWLCLTYFCPFGTLLTSLPNNIVQKAVKKRYNHPQKTIFQSIKFVMNGLIEAGKKGKVSCQSAQSVCIFTNLFNEFCQNINYTSQY